MLTFVGRKEKKVKEMPKILFLVYYGEGYMAVSVLEHRLS